MSCRSEMQQRFSMSMHHYILKGAHTHESVRHIYCGMYMPLSDDSDDKHQMVPDSSKKCTGQHGHNSNPVATLPHAAVVFRMQPFNLDQYCTGYTVHKFLLLARRVQIPMYWIEERHSSLILSKK